MGSRTQSVRPSDRLLGRLSVLWYVPFLVLSIRQRRLQHRVSVLVGQAQLAFVNPSKKEDLPLTTILSCPCISRRQESRQRVCFLRETSSPTKH